MKDYSIALAAFAISSFLGLALIEVLSIFNILDANNADFIALCTGGLILGAFLGAISTVLNKDK